jgi:hypothetical protein
MKEIRKQKKKRKEKRKKIKRASGTLRPNSETNP